MVDSPKNPDGLMPDVLEEARRARPSTATASVVLLLIAALLWIPIAGGDPAITQAASLLLFLHILFAVRTLRGRQKARITVSVVTLILLFLLIPHVWMGFTDPGYPSGPAYAVMDIIAITASCTGVVLLFTPSSNTYFRGTRTDAAESTRDPMGDQVPHRMPGSIRFALAGVWFQAVVNGLGGWWLMSEVNDRLDHGQDVSHLGLIQISAYFSFAVAAVLALCAVYALKRSTWVRATVVAVESLAVLGVLIGILFGTGPGSIIALALAVWIGSVMLTKQARTWFYPRTDTSESPARRVP